MVNVDKNIISEIFEEYKPLAIFQVGSSIVCKNPQDIDVLVVYENQAELEEKFKGRKCLHDDRGYKYEVFSNSLDNMKVGMENFMYEGGKYLKFLAGDEEAVNVSQFNVLENESFKRACLEKLLDRILSIKFADPDEPKYMSSYTNKPYRLLMSCFILDNNSYDLTKKQVAAINKAHDEVSISEEQLEYCYEVVTRLIKEYSK